MSDTFPKWLEDALNRGQRGVGVGASRQQPQVRTDWPPMRLDPRQEDVLKAIWGGRWAYGVGPRR